MKSVNILKITFVPCLFFLFFSTFLSKASIPQKPPAKVPYKIVNTYPHPPGSFTQGLAFANGFLYEGTGKYGLSSLRKIRLESGEILKEYKLPQDLFGEGITIFQDKIIQLTWYARTGFVYDKESFQLFKTFRYPFRIQGWGITNDGKHLIISDGSHRLYFIDPISFAPKKILEVYDHNGSVRKINELEYIEGVIFANVWQTSRIIRIDPSSGMITGIIDLSEIVPRQYRGHLDYVLNGIAYDSEGKRIFVTGKMWPRVYELDLLKSE
ncbi:MAG: glutaminyl-peptide cyclotransferase [Candidatus Aminicenantaceae bacterium]